MLFKIDISENFRLPEEYKGKTMKNGGYTKNSPRIWTMEEVNWVQNLQKKGFSIKQIAECIDRDITQVSIKLKRLKKISTEYNEKHKEDKYKSNNIFFDLVKPKTILDIYAGSKSYWDKFNVNLITNDKNQKFQTTFNLDALSLCCQEYMKGNKYDLIDIDPFGSAYDCFDLAIKMAKKGIIITLGEIGHKRFKRLDFVTRYYDIEKIEDFTTENLVKHIIKIGIRNKKKLIPVIVKDWKNISRVYFLIEKIKII